MCLAIPGELLNIDTSGDLLTGVVSIAGVKKEICLAFTPEAAPGNFVLVHSGFAIAVIEKNDAKKLIRIYEGGASQIA